MMLQTPFTRDPWPIAPSVSAAAQGGAFRSILAWTALPAFGSILIAIAAAFPINGWDGLVPFSSTGSFDFVAISGAAIVAHAYLRRMATLPPFVTNTQVFPVLGVTFAAALGAVSLAGVVYNAVSFAAAFVAILLWYFVLGAARAKLFKRRVAFIGEQVPASFSTHHGIEWTLLNEPLLSEPVSALVVGRGDGLTPEWEHFIGQAVVQGIPVHDSRHMEEIFTGRVQLRHLMENSFGTLLPSLIYVRIKRYLDFLLACIALVVVVPVVALCAFLIRLESRGPAIFRQARTGFRGRPFTCYKLRTMRHGGTGPSFTLENDARITRLGRYLRKFRIDELPQIFNILKGEMSWIGPRPESVDLADAYEAVIPYYVYRHAVRPGVSGWAAVHQGNVGNVDAAAIKLQYDLFYIKYCSFWLDALIFFKTLKTVFTGFGSK